MDDVELRNEANLLYFGADYRPHYGARPVAETVPCEICGTAILTGAAVEFYVNDDGTDTATLIAHRFCGEKADLREA